MRTRILILLSLTFLVVVAGCITEHEPELTLASFTTDKDLYHSKDTMIVRIGLNATGDMENVYINISGIVNKRGRIMIYNETTVNLTRGLNEIEFIERMPSCSRCSGLSEGTYHLNMTVVYRNRTIINETTPGALIAVELRQ
ncbi:MAG: hypothetical protein CW694_07510 [Candidatus Syntrophoarchaeum sp. WYZ-LMO15]|nr:MAG: hypothetical protein CW694_07510 [Candidatus Syntrophoarchaeum sp. WYZ-LMO15]